MTLNITVASPRFVICATDRRLTDMATRGIQTEQSTKLTLLQCRDALALIAYNGIGRWYGRTPADWILELDERVNLTSLCLLDVLEQLRMEADSRIGSMPKRYDRRHTFVIGAWRQGLTWIYVISNYERADTNRTERIARSNFAISFAPPGPGAEVRVLVTGATPDIDLQDHSSISHVAAKAGAAGVDIKNLCVKAIRKAAKRRANRGTVGSSVLWAIVDGRAKVECGLDVPDGTTVHTMPNMIEPGGKMKDIRIETARGESVTLGKSFPLPERRCSECGNPVPLGYQRCGVCGSKM